MQNAIEIKHLTREEKLRMVDASWKDLLSEEELLESPFWHKRALQETEKHFAEGKERINGDPTGNRTRVSGVRVPVNEGFR